MLFPSIVSSLFNLALIKLPILIIKSVPRCSSIISLAHLYLFMQALGILWLLFVSAVSVAATRLGTSAMSSFGSLSELPRSALQLWVHVSIFRVGIGFGKSLWRNGWETYADFPTCKTLLNPKSAVTISTRSAQIVILMCPLVVFGVIAGIIALIQLALFVWPPREDFGDPSSGRLSRMARFTVWIGLLQWAQMFQFVFPNWAKALSGLSLLRRIIFSCILMFLIPLSLSRCFQWFIFTAPSTIPSPFYTVSGVSWDCLLMMAWSAVMYEIAASVLGSRENLVLAGWKREAFTKDEIWREGAILMKFGFLLACVILFVRSFINPNRGFSYAQNDLVVLTVSYPLLMVVTWFSTNSVLVLLKKRFSALIVLFFGPLSLLLCTMASIFAPGAVIGLWIQFIKFFVRPKTTKRAAVLSLERDLASRILKFAMPFTFMYGSILLILSLLQQTNFFESRSYPSEYMTVSKPNSSHSVAIRHAVSQIDLFFSSRDSIRSESNQDLPIYGICNQKFWGLDVVDYGLFSMLSYAGSSEVIDKALADIFPTTIKVVTSDEKNEKNQFWTEFNVNNETTVIAVRGSEYWSVSDYLEDLRMWTEPVAKSLVTLVFPTVRAWSPKTTAMVFDAYQEFLAFIGLPDDQEYKYQRLLEYISLRKFPPGHNVVLTGHSLGGGIASITGTIARLPTVTFLSPGMYQTASKFFFHSSKNSRQIVDMVHNQSLSIQVENDFVGKYLDSHAGLVQTITCSVDHLAPLTCHLIDNSICNLIRHCRDPRWPGGCSFKYDFNIFLNSTFPSRSYMPLQSLAQILNQWFNQEQLDKLKTRLDEL